MFCLFCSNSFNYSFFGFSLKIFSNGKDLLLCGRPQNDKERVARIANRVLVKSSINNLKILVPFLEFVGPTKPLGDLVAKADGLERHKIDIVPWPLFDYKPDVSFTIAHGNDCVLLKYYVAEESVRAIYCNPNEPVYKDTCVEFFISFEGEKEYYNFEFNCVGTCLSGFGLNRAKRELLPEAIIRKIESQSVFTSFNNSVTGNMNWELTLMIPIQTFYFHSFNSLKNKNCKVNFYKCGDDLPKPHFLAWNDIKAPSPDFHLQEYFGEMKFE